MRSVLRHDARLFALATSVVLTTPGAASAADIKVLTTGAFKPVVSALVADFEARTGHKVEVVNDTAGAVSRRVAVGNASAQRASA